MLGTNCVTAQLWRLLRQSQHYDCIRVKQTAPTAFSLRSRRDTSQTSLMTFGCTKFWGIQNLWPGRGSALNTHLLLSPVMESVNLEHWPNAFVRMLLLFTEVSKLFCKESFLLASNSDFHCTTEKNPDIHFLKKYHTLIHLRKYLIKWKWDFVAGECLVKAFVLYNLWLLDIKITLNGRKYL